MVTCCCSPSQAAGALGLGLGAASAKSFALTAEACCYEHCGVTERLVISASLTDRGHFTLSVRLAPAANQAAGHRRRRDRGARGESGGRPH